MERSPNKPLIYCRINGEFYYSIDEELIDEKNFDAFAIYIAEKYHSEISEISEKDGMHRICIELTDRMTNDANVLYEGYFNMILKNSKFKINYLKIKKK